MRMDFVDQDKEQGFPFSLRFVSTSGEKFTPAVVYKFFSKLQSDVTLLNLYGCTEVTADASCQALTCLRDVQKYTCEGKLSIGSMINNTTAIPTRESGHDGREWELSIAGAAVSARYINLLSSSHENGNSTLFHHPNHGWSFRTGDLVKQFQPDTNSIQTVLVFVAGLIPSSRSTDKKWMYRRLQQ